MEERADRSQRIFNWINDALILGVFVVVLAIFWTTFRVRLVAVSESPDGQYQLRFQVERQLKQTGVARGKLVLQKRNKKVTEQSFQLQTQDKKLTEANWQVNWLLTGAEVLLFGADEQVLQINLNADENIEWREPSFPEIEEPQVSEAPIEEPEISQEEQQQADGFRAIYGQVFQPLGWSMIQDWTAKGNPYILLFEDPERVEYLMYDRTSANGACGLYVHYHSDKNADGSWSTMDGEIQEMYAYVYDTGAVIPAGKTAWSDPGTPEYQQATGE